MERTAEQRHARIIYVVLAIVTFALYCPVFNYSFVFYDDPTYVTGNPYVQRGLTSASVAWAFTTGHGSNWHPLTWMSHMLDAQIFGPEHPGGHHLTSVLFHIANTLLLFLVLRRYTGALWRSAVVAALFAWHPMHVESVAWISERKDVLSTFFGLLTMLAYQRYVVESSAQNPKAKNHYLLALGFFALSLMSKPMLVTLPFVLLLLDYWPLARIAEIKTAGANSSLRKIPFTRLVAEKLPFFALTVASSLITYFVQKAGGAVMEAEKLPLGMRIPNALFAYLGYLGKLFWPANLTIYYPLTPVPRPLPLVLGAALLLVALTIVALFAARRRAYVLFGWLWFLGILVPVIGLVQVGSAAMADRYSYLSYVGLFIVIVWGIADLFGKGRLNQPGVAWAIIGPALLICIVLTAHEIPYWKNTETLFRRNLSLVQDNSVARVNLGVYYDKIGRPGDAKAEFTAALNLQHSGTTLNAMGLHYAKQGDTTNAANYYVAALNSQPYLSDAHYNLANILAGEGKLAEAAEHYQEAIRLKPDSADAHNNLGAVLVRLGRLPEALDQFKDALRLLPDYPEAEDQLGGVFLKLGHPDVAQLHYETAIRLKPDFAHAQLKLGLVLAEQGSLAEAIPHLQTAIKLEPTNDAAYFNLAAAYAALNRRDAAAQAFSEVIRLKPDDVQAHIRLAAILQSDGKTADAILNFREALRLRADSPPALQGLAWIFATSAKPEFRNGAEAVRLAEQANQLTGQKQLPMLMALDAAYAEVGRFDDAIKTAEQVRQLASSQNQPALAEKAAQRLALYHAGKPYHEPQ